ncbi:hypothetical protein ABZ953_05340 [Streptomyces sp. NPDC046465]|uniref:hypothetical protein n=1 Tax=Streptomyces sp. NPDC046465 TaxID=3155810 RepID=UPI0033F30923
MRTRPMSSLTGATVAGAALLMMMSGCGGSGPDTSARIPGVRQGDVGRSPSGAPAPKAAGRPTVTLPKAFRADFEGWSHNDPKLQTILDDGKERLRAGYAAIVKGDPEDAALEFYSAGAALKSAPAWVKTYKGLTLIGTVRVFDNQVHVSNEGFAVLFYCVDESRAFSKNRKTRKVEGTPEGQDPKVQYRTRLDKDAEGVWKTTSVETDRGGCRT